MSQRFIWTALLASMMLLNTACATSNDREYPVENLIENIENDLRPGMQSSDVEGYFRSKNIEFTYMSAETLASQPIQLAPPETYDGLKGIYTGIIRNVRSSASVTTGVKIYVEVGVDDRVRAVQVNKEHAGL